MSILDTIKKANIEYERGRRSNAFIAIEDEIAKSKNMIHVYWFARYVKGADIGRLQAIILEKGSMEDCFYFSKYVRGVNINLFLNRALNERDIFWIQRLTLVALSPFNNRIDDIIEFKDELEQYGIKLEDKSTIGGLKRDDITNVINHANEEHKRRGRSKKFVEFERRATFSIGEGADVFLFAQNVSGANLKNLQKAILLHGSPLDMFLFAQEINGTDKEVMLSGLKLAQYDYVTIQDREKKRLIRLDKCCKQLDEAIQDGADKGLINMLNNRKKQIEAEESYLDMVRDYYRRVQAMIARSANNK